MSEQFIYSSIFYLIYSSISVVSPFNRRVFNVLILRFKDAMLHYATSRDIPVRVRNISEDTQSMGS